MIMDQLSQIEQFVFSERANDAHSRGFVEPTLIDEITQIRILKNIRLVQCNFLLALNNECLALNYGHPWNDRRGL